MALAAHARIPLSPLPVNSPRSAHVSQKSAVEHIKEKRSIECVDDPEYPTLTQTPLLSSLSSHDSVLDKSTRTEAPEVGVFPQSFSMQVSAHTFDTLF